MTARGRLSVFAVGALVLFGALVLALAHLPAFGQQSHRYGDQAIQAAVNHTTPNVISAISFDQRAFDTYGEESILVLSVLGAAMVLRKGRDETETDAEGDATAGVRPAVVADVVSLLGYVMLPLTLFIGFYLVVHGHLSPGGGFQGGVVLATAVHLVYVAGSYGALDKVRPVKLAEGTEAFGVLTYAAIGCLGLAGAGYLANVLPQGQFRGLLSSGTVPLLNGAVGIAVTSGIVVLLSEFLEQTVQIRPTEDDGS